MNVPRRLGPRSEVIDTAEGVEIRIRAPRHWWPLVFLPIWLVGWTVGGAFAIVEFTRDPGARGFLGVWLVWWLLGELFAALAWSWMAFGMEVISIRLGVLNIGRRIGSWGIVKHYRLHECSNLRPAGWFGSPFSFSASLRPLGLSGGTVAFDHGGKVIRFGFSLDEAEAGSVAKELAGHVRPNT